MRKIDIVAGARPNFMKIGPIIHAIQKLNRENDDPIEFRLIHTGQHYDKKLSSDFFDQLNIPKPDLNLGVGSGSAAWQTGQIMLKYEEAINDWRPELCLVVGDVTSTMACSITAKKEWVKVAHVEGGIRSGDEKMPEEINRMVTDSITDYFFTTSEIANNNLIALGHKKEKIFFVGNTMIDSLMENLNRLIVPEIINEQGLKSDEYLVLTLHRPSNVDKVERLTRFLDVINENLNGKRIIFPMHPRTKKSFSKIEKSFDNIIVTDPLSYLEFIYCVKNSSGVITDSGGITEETTVLQIPCITLRDSTERPETVTQGTNELVGTNPDDLPAYMNKLLEGNWKQGNIPPLWDGKTSERIVDIIYNHI